MWQSFECCGKKIIGKPCEGKPHARFEVAGDGKERWYEAFYHHLRMEMDEYRRIRRSLRALKANTDYEEELYEEAI